MAQFSIASKITVGEEGRVLRSVPGDRGGETYVGISRVMNPTWQGWAYIDSRRAQLGFPGILYADQALEAMLQAFYKATYWDTFSGDQVPDQAVANRVFDASVNLGGVEHDFLQQALNLLAVDGDKVIYQEVKEDGVIGPATLAALSANQLHGDRDHLLQILVVLQGERYINICRQDLTQRKFIRGWLNRDFQES